MRFSKTQKLNGSHKNFNCNMSIQQSTVFLQYTLTHLSHPGTSSVAAQIQPCIHNHSRIANSSSSVPCNSDLLSAVKRPERPLLARCNPLAWQCNPHSVHWTQELLRSFHCTLLRHLPYCMQGRHLHDNKEGVAVREWIRKQQPSFQCDGIF